MYNLKLTFAKEVTCEVKRLKNFILGLLIVAIVGFLLFMYIDDSRIQSYQDYFLQFNWFQPLLIGLAGLLILIGLILVLSILNLRIANLDFIKTLMMDIFTYHVKLLKTIYDTIAKYDQVRQPNVVSKLYNKKNKSFIDIKTDFFVPNHVQVKSLTESIRADIKSNVEHFTEIPVRKLEVNVRDQKTSGPRVL